MQASVERVTSDQVGNWGGAGRNAGMKAIHSKKMERRRVGVTLSIGNYLKRLNHPKLAGERRGASAALRFIIRWYAKNGAETTLAHVETCTGRPAADSQAEKVAWRSYHISDKQLAFVDNEAEVANCSRSEMLRNIVRTHQTETKGRSSCKFCSIKLAACSCGHMEVPPLSA